MFIVVKDWWRGFCSLEYFSLEQGLMERLLFFGVFFFGAVGAVTAWRKQRCSCFRNEKKGSCSCTRIGSRCIIGRLEWSCQDFWSMQWCFDSVKLRARLRARWSLTFCVKYQVNRTRYVRSTSSSPLFLFNRFLCCDVGCILQILRGLWLRHEPIDLPFQNVVEFSSLFAARCVFSKKSFHVAYYIYILLMRSV